MSLTFSNLHTYIHEDIYTYLFFWRILKKTLFANKLQYLYIDTTKVLSYIFIVPWSILCIWPWYTILLYCLCSNGSFLIIHPNCWVELFNIILYFTVMSIMGNPVKILCNFFLHWIFCFATVSKSWRDILRLCKHYAHFWPNSCQKSLLWYKWLPNSCSPFPFTKKYIEFNPKQFISLWMNYHSSPYLFI